MQNSDRDLMRKILSLSDPERSDLFEFLGVTPKSKTELDKIFAALTVSIALRQTKAKRLPN